MQVEGSGLTVQGILHLLGDCKDTLVSVETLEVPVSNGSDFAFVVAFHFIVKVIYWVTRMWCLVRCNTLTSIK
jgi:hypothetical protein